MSGKTALKYTFQSSPYSLRVLGFTASSEAYGFLGNLKLQTSVNMDSDTVNQIAV